MIRFAYPNVSFSNEEFIGCGRYAAVSSDFTPGSESRYLDNIPNTSNASAIVKAAKILTRAPYDPERLIYESQDEHDPEEEYQGDSCSLAFLLALIHRSRPVAGAGSSSFDLWCTGNIRFDQMPLLDAVYPHAFDVKLDGFCNSGGSEPIFIVPAANMLQHHEARCLSAGLSVLEFSQCRSELKTLLDGRKTVLKVDLDELPALVEWLFEPPPRGSAQWFKPSILKWLLPAAALLALGFAGMHLSDSFVRQSEGEREAVTGALGVVHQGEPGGAEAKPPSSSPPRDSHGRPRDFIDGSPPPSGGGEGLTERSAAERRARIDTLIDGLSRAYREDARPASDGWVSRPLYIFFLPLEATGHPAATEGEEALLLDRITRGFVGPGRCRLVDRTALERLLEELKLSHSEIANPDTALRLGKILSARAIAVGAIHRGGGEMEITMRAIDTETSMVVAAASAATPLGEAPKAMLDGLSRDFRERITTAYPIRGRITGVDGRVLRLNIGGSVGVTAGMRFRLVDNGSGSPGVEISVTEVHRESSLAEFPEGSSPPVAAGAPIEQTDATHQEAGSLTRAGFAS